MYDFTAPYVSTETEGYTQKIAFSLISLLVKCSGVGFLNYIHPWFTCTNPPSNGCCVGSEWRENTITGVYHYLFGMTLNTSALLTFPSVCVQDKALVHVQKLFFFFLAFFLYLPFWSIIVYDIVRSFHFTCDVH